MKLIVSHNEKKRPYLLGLTAVILASSAGLFAATAIDLVIENQAVQVMFVLARMSITLIPSAIWFGAVFITALWLAMIVRVWRA